MAKLDNAKMAEQIIAAVGGKENIASVTHCMTRLRFNLKDDGLAEDEEIKKIDGVISVVRAGDQVQVVVGQGVDRVYAEVCKAGGLEVQAVIDENLDGGPKKKLTLKQIGSNIMGALSGSITPVLPVFIVCGSFKMVAVLLGPENLVVK